ncbi:hypothetical protein [Sulfitobacter sp. 1A12157]|uniref:hypothetical protein n=1 Tax=Sulfitobacter sp. 1A12157 TaxID=3368594 RepID=UPI003746E02C
MQKPSFNGYLISVDIRKTKTLLVEGSSDKRIIHRLAANETECSPDDYVIDTAEYIRLPPEVDWDDIGNKAKVLKAYSQLKRNAKFAILVDREWEGLRSSEGTWTRFKAPATCGNKFITSGHSIENYSFEPDYFTEAIIAKCYEFFVIGQADQIHSNFRSCLIMALAISEVFSEAQILKRSLGLFRPSDFSWDAPDELALNDRNGLMTRMTEREIDGVREKLDRITELYQKMIGDFEFGPIKFYLHGHLGEEIVRATIASKLISMGVPETSADRFFTEGKEAWEERMREYYSQLEILPPSLEKVLNFLKK